MKYFLLRQLYFGFNAFSTQVNQTPSATDSGWQSMAIISLTVLVIFWLLGHLYPMSSFTPLLPQVIVVAMFYFMSLWAS